jgi:hypothetical protein
MLRFQSVRFWNRSGYSVIFLTILLLTACEGEAVSDLYLIALPTTGYTITNTGPAGQQTTETVYLVTANKRFANAGETITLTATPRDAINQRRLVSWSWYITANGASTATPINVPANGYITPKNIVWPATEQFVMPNANVTVTAAFENSFVTISESTEPSSVADQDKTPGFPYESPSVRIAFTQDGSNNRTGFKIFPDPLPANPNLPVNYQINKDTVYNITFTGKSDTDIPVLTAAVGDWDDTGFWLAAAPGARITAGIETTLEWTATAVNTEEAKPTAASLHNLLLLRAEDEPGQPISAAIVLVGVWKVKVVAGNAAE